MLPYFQKAEGMEKPKTDGPQKLLKKVDYAPEYHGDTGPIHTSFTPFEYPLEAAWLEAAQKVVGQVDPTKDAWSGDHLGVFHNLCTVNRSNNLGTRSYAASGYYDHVRSHPNLKVVTNALVTKVLLDREQAKPRAFAVQALYGGETFTIQCRREVILCAGATRSSQLLELSGIGSPEVLAAAGVETILPNEFVGENLQDHIATGLVHEIADGEFSMDTLQEPERLKAAIQKYSSMEGGPVSTAFGAMSFASLGDFVTQDDLANLAKGVEDWNKNSDSRFLIQRTLQLEALKSKKSGTFQFIHLPCNMNFGRGDDQQAFLAPDPSGSLRTTLAVCLQTPFSRGSSHIISSSPEKQPAIDPAYLEDPTDVKLLIKGLQIGQQICKARPLADRLKTQVQPPREIDLTDMDAAERWLRENTVTEYHPMGTASLGLVVDSCLRVFGTLGLRVCDASVFPSCVSGNIQSVVYAIAEKAAVMIKEDGLK
jgi:choline dehydrogenase-like flavoprotein